jgi:hypothetical protein
MDFGKLLEEYVTYSSNYPHRLEFDRHLSKNDINEIKEVCMSQLDYAYLIQNPGSLRHVAFFENEEHVTLMKMIIDARHEEKYFNDTEEI